MLNISLTCYNECMYNPQSNRFVVQIITSLIFFWALFQFLGNPGLLTLAIGAAAGYVWYTNDYKFEMPRSKVKDMIAKSKNTKRELR